MHSLKSQRSTSALFEFYKRQDGVVSVEALLWLLLYFPAVMLIVDVSMIFNGQNMAYKNVQDANRQASIGRLSTTSQVESYISTNIASFAPHAVATSTMAAGQINSTVRIPVRDLLLTGWFDALANFDVVVSGSHVIEF